MEKIGVNNYTVFVMGDANPRKLYGNRGFDGLYIVNYLKTPGGSGLLFYPSLRNIPARRCCSRSAAVSGVTRRGKTRKNTNEYTHSERS